MSEIYPFHYPESLEIRPFSGNRLNASVCVPGSKSITNRALLLAAINFAEEPCTLRGVLRCEDTEVMIQALRHLGFQFDVNWADSSIQFPENTQGYSLKAADLFVSNSGTTMRFLTALCSLGNQPIRIDGVGRMRERPIEDLLVALRQLGVEARSERGNGCPPVVIRGHGPWKWKAGRVVIRGNISSQFLSALLMVAPFGSEEVIEIELDGPLVSVPYVEMTLRLMKQFGTPANWIGSKFIVSSAAWASPCPREFTIEPDASAASYYFAAAAILGGRITVLGLPEDSLQGDVHFVDVLEQMGCRVEKCSSGITVHGGPLRGIDVDMNAISDTMMTLGAVACFASGPTTIRNVAHIRHKETDRIVALATELRKIGAVVDEFADGLRITPGPLQGASISTYNDHRMAMSMALIGLKVPGVIIRKPGCVAKTYPGFWQDWSRYFGEEIVE
jgi:3-phosphoshikimate 1-carboxyvinyltransferase